MIITILFLFSWFLVGQLTWYLIIKDAIKYGGFIGLDIMMLFVFIAFGYVGGVIVLILAGFDWIADNLNRNR